MSEPTEATASLAVLREVMRRVALRHGVPMLIALADERDVVLPPCSPGARADGALLAHRVEQIGTALAPGLPAWDNGGVVCALLVAANDMLDGAPRVDGVPGG